MPVDGVGCRIPVQLVADIDQVLDRGDVDVVDRGEVEDDRFEGRAGFVVFVGFGYCGAGRARVVPGAVLGWVLVLFC